MKPIFHVPLDGRCMDACLASLFHLTFEASQFNCTDRYIDKETNKVVCTNSDHKETWGEDRYKCHTMEFQNRRIEEWAAPFGLTLTHVSVTHDSRAFPKAYDRPLPPGLCIAAGPADRGHNHAVVWDTRLRDFEYPLGRMVHDPYPHPNGERPGLHEVSDFYWFEVVDPSLLPKLNPPREDQP